MLPLTFIHLALAHQQTDPVFCLGLLAAGLSHKPQQIQQDNTTNQRNLIAIGQYLKQDGISLQNQKYMQGYGCGLLFLQFCQQHPDLPVRIQPPNLNEKAQDLAYRENIKLFYMPQSKRLAKQIKKLSDFLLPQELDFLPAPVMAQKYLQTISFDTCCPVIAKDLVIITQKNYEDFLQKSSYFIQQNAIF